MRIVFMGSPKFAVPSLDAVSNNFDVIGVITQPDRPSGRGRKLTPPSVKLRAEKLDLDVYQPLSMKSPESEDLLRHLDPEIVVVAAYGQILPQSILDIPAYGIINVHASLLPRWRGAAPVQASILHGDELTGITIMLMDAGMDTGPILSHQSLRILPDETGGQLTERLANLGAEILPMAIRGYTSGQIKPKPQDDDAATYAPILRKSDGLLDFSKPAEYLERQVRAFEPWPSSFFYWEGTRVVVRRAYALESDTALDPGEATSVKGVPAISASDGILVLESLQPAGKRVMPGEDFLRGAVSFVDSQIQHTKT